MHPVKQQFVDMPLPFGARARLILIHLNGEALRTGSPEIEVEDSLTAFARRILGRHPRGRDIHTFKDQLGALSTATVRLGIANGERAVQLTGQIVEALDLWAPLDPRQRVLWPSTIQLGERYFASLSRHAVPLDERAVAGLAHSAMGLDIYAWLAQRLHRVPGGRPQLVPWTALHQQFGQSYRRIRKFREIFRHTLAEVCTQYSGARIEADRRGLTLRNSCRRLLRLAVGQSIGCLNDPVDKSIYPRSLWGGYHAHFGAVTTLTLGRKPVVTGRNL